MFADLVGVDGFGVDGKIVGDFEAKAGRIENGAAANDAFGGETGVAVSEVTQGIHGVGDDEEDAVKAGFHDVSNDAFGDGGVFLKEVNAGFARFLVGASGKDADVATLGFAVAASADFEPAGGDRESVAEIHGFAFGVGGVNIG